MRSALLLPLLLVMPLPVRAPDLVDEAFESARGAWHRGDYPAALRRLDSLLTSPSAERLRDRIALLTGELYESREITPDGRNVRLSGDGSWLSFERGAAPRQYTHVLNVHNGSRGDSLLGWGASLSANGATVAVLRAPLSDSLTFLGSEWERRSARGDVAGANSLVGRMSQIQARSAMIAVRAADGGAETLLREQGLMVASPVLSADGSQIYFLSRSTAQAGMAVSVVSLATRRRRELTDGDSARADLTLSGDKLLYTIGRDAFGTGVARAFAVLDLATGSERTFVGFNATLARDGSAVSYLQRQGAETWVIHQALDETGSSHVIKRTTDRLANPTISPDGRWVAMQLMAREDWEVVVVDAEGKEERRLTYDPQHDVNPRWVSDSLLLAAKGEGRHLRSYLYSIGDGASERLFHNNTIRTIAPEYDWIVARDGSHLAIVAERDGDTVSPQRGVYTVDLTRRVSVLELRRRVAAMLRDEVALRRFAKRVFTPISSFVRSATSDVEKERLYAYQRTLFSFDSKHISRPGNAKAIQYLREQYASFGYQPVVQEFEARPGVRSANVVATLRGTTHPDVVYVVGSHFDSVADGPGADDNTSGTSMLLETARVLAKHPLPATVIFVSFTGEEAGLLGSREFVRRLRADSVRLAGALNNDMMGYANDERLDNTIRYSNAGIRDIQHAAALEFSKLITYDALYYKNTDAGAFYEVYGDIVGGIGSYPVLANPHYHQRHDVLETINQELVYETTRTNLASIIYLASAPSRVTGVEAERKGGSAEVSWRANPERDVVGYVVAWRALDGRERQVMVRGTRTRLSGVAPTSEIRVKAVNARGLEGWDWGRG